MYYKSKDKLKIYYEIIKNKNKPFIVFIHGFCGNIKSFKYQKDFFKKKYNILSIDLRGHGKSDKPKKEFFYKKELMINDVTNIIKKEKIKDFILIGFSLGGHIALNLPIKAKKIILINPLFNSNSVRKVFLIQEFISRFVPKFILKLFIKSYNIYEFNNLLETYGKLLYLTPLYVRKNIMKNIKNFKSIKKSFLNKKCLVIKSNYDEVINKKIPLTNYTLKKINGFHYIIAQKPNKINKLISEYLK